MNPLFPNPIPTLRQIRDWLTGAAKGTPEDPANVALIGSSTVETLVDAQVIAAGSNVQFTVDPKGAREAWVLVSIDQQPWQMTVRNDPITGVSGADFFYPLRGPEVKTYAPATPAHSLMLGIAPASYMGLEPPASLKEAKDYLFPAPARTVRVTNQSSATATATVKVLRVW